MSSRPRKKNLFRSSLRVLVSPQDFYRTLHSASYRSRIFGMPLAPRRPLSEIRQALARRQPLSDKPSRGVNPCRKSDKPSRGVNLVGNPTSPRAASTLVGNPEIRQALARRQPCRKFAEDPTPLRTPYSLADAEEHARRARFSALTFQADGEERARPIMD